MADQYVERARELQELEETVNRKQTIAGLGFAVAIGCYYFGLKIGGAAIMNPLGIIVAVVASAISWRIFRTERRVKQLKQSLES